MRDLMNGPVHNSLERLTLMESSLRDLHYVPQTQTAKEQKEPLAILTMCESECHHIAQCLTEYASVPSSVSVSLPELSISALIDVHIEGSRNAKETETYWKQQYFQMRAKYESIEKELKAMQIHAFHGHSRQTRNVIRQLSNALDEMLEDINDCSLEEQQDYAYCKVRLQALCDGMRFSGAGSQLLTDAMRNVSRSVDAIADLQSKGGDHTKRIVLVHILSRLRIRIASLDS